MHRDVKTISKEKQVCISHPCGLLCLWLPGTHQGDKASTGHGQLSISINCVIHRCFFSRNFTAEAA